MQSIKALETQYKHQMSVSGTPTGSPTKSRSGSPDTRMNPADVFNKSTSSLPPIPSLARKSPSPKRSLFRLSYEEAGPKDVSPEASVSEPDHSFSTNPQLNQSITSESSSSSRKPFFTPNFLLKSQRSLYEQAALPIKKPESRSSSVEEDELRDSVGTLNYFDRKGYKVANDSYNSSLFKSSTTSLASVASESHVFKEQLPDSVKLVVESRPSNQIHELDVFDGAQYAVFWHITDDEAKVLTDWSPLEFHRQNAIFELFLLLRKFRLNLKRMVVHYGPAFKVAKNLTPDQDADYQKTFVPIDALYAYLEKLVNKRLKPAFDNHFFVNDRYVLECWKNWLVKLERDYEYISRSMVYLAKLAANEQFRDWIRTTEETDELAYGNNYLASARELFHSYFLQVFAPMRLMMLDLKKLYIKLEDETLTMLAQEIFDLLNRINKIGDYTTDLDKKIELNKKLVCTDYLYLEMVDLFNKHRRLRVPIDIHLLTAISSDRAVLYLLDNYLLPLVKRDHKDAVYLLNKPPVALQYLGYSVLEEESGKTLILKDSGNGHTYHIRSERVDAPTLLNHFVKDIPKYKDDLFERLSKNYELKLVNGTSFQLPTPFYEYPVAPIEREQFDMVHRAVSKSKFQPNSVAPLASTSVTCVDTVHNKRELFFIAGTSDGLYMGKADQPSTWKKICTHTDVIGLKVLHDKVCFILIRDKLYRISTAALVESYTDERACNAKMEQIAKGVNSFVIGPQSIRKGPVVMECEILFCWTDKKIMFSIVTTASDQKLKFESMKPTFKVLGIHLLYPTDFVICHVNENNPIFYLSNLNTMGNTQLNKTDHQKDLKSRIRGQRPIGAFKLFLNDTLTDYDLLLVYTRYCMFVRYTKEQVISSSRTEILRFDFDVHDATFDSYEQILVLCGEQNVEVWKIFKDRQIKSELVGCFIGPGAKILNKTPGKTMIGVLSNEQQFDKATQLILHLRKRK
ncbi:hypothetical protein OGAPHI_003908 [Ogataea philodendri]|uniref:CNH domain-containing protein n=1 Tax=Ogataea philodendri TaxID=1378263 RepID=A0A9P8T549_9ASCO|nr:uncharacterized protein OGAPHI_003908 [Ogataea philodendri]KAH3665720.1 hypothetical protein OGAPHI_003908 [Ogataea philodendri]